MRRSVPLVVLFTHGLYAQTWNSYLAYSTDSVFADTAFVSNPGSSACPGSVTINFPVGEVVDSVHVAYDFWSYASLGGGTGPMQRALLRCPTTGLDEGALTLCGACSPDGEHYERSTSIANGVSSGSVTIELHLGTTRSTSAPNCSLYDMVELGQWQTTVYTHIGTIGMEEGAITAHLAWTGDVLRIDRAQGSSILEVMDGSGRTIWERHIAQGASEMEVHLPARFKGVLCARLLDAQGASHVRFVR